MIQFSGLVSGLDSGAIIDQLVAAERAPINRINARRSQANSRLSTIGSLISQMQSLKTSAEGLDTSDEVRAFSATSSNEERIKVTASGTATDSTYNINVGRLATAETSQSKGFASDTAGIIGAGTFDITLGSGTPQTVTVDADDSLTTLASKINDLDMGVTASVLDDGTDFHLVITGDEAGADNSITFTDASSLMVMDEKVQANNAQVTFNNITVERPTNILTDVIPGLTLNLESTTPVGGDETVVKVSRDAEGQRSKVQGLVDAFNAVANVLSRELNYSGTEKGADSLFGDPTIQGLQRQLGATLSAGYSHNGENVTLGNIGVNLSSAGTLSLDQEKFDEALAEDPTLVEGLLAGTGGLSQALQDLVDQYTQAGDGVLQAKQDSINSILRDYDKQIERLEDQAGSLSQRLNNQFNALEVTMVQLQSQQSFLASMLF